MNMRKTVMVPLLLLMALGLMGNDGCVDDNTDRAQTRETEVMVEEAHVKVGMPGITNFTERRFAKMILELRDEELSTYTYIVDMQGDLHFVCESVGYGLPYSVQFTNPERYMRNGATLPQPDPNGLFMPQGLDATFVLCSDGEGGIHPFYSEPKLLVSPFPLRSVDSYLPTEGDAS